MEEAAYQLCPCKYSSSFNVPSFHNTKIGCNAEREINTNDDGDDDDATLDFQAFSMAFLRSLVPMFAEKTNRLINLVKEKVDQPVVMQDLTTLLTLEIICKVFTCIHGDNSLNSTYRDCK